MGRGPRGNQSITASSLLFGPRRAHQHLDVDSFSDLVAHHFVIVSRGGKSKLADMAFEMIALDDNNKLRQDREAPDVIMEKVNGSIHYFAKPIGTGLKTEKQRADDTRKACQLSDHDLARIEAAQYDAALTVAQMIIDKNPMNLLTAEGIIKGSGYKKMDECVQSNLADVICVYGVDPLALSHDISHWKTWPEVGLFAGESTLETLISHHDWISAAESIATIMATTLANDKTNIVGGNFDVSYLQAHGAHGDKSPHGSYGDKVRWMISEDCAGELAKADGRWRRMKSNDSQTKTFPADQVRVTSSVDNDLAETVVKHVARASGMSEADSRLYVGAVARHIQVLQKSEMGRWVVEKDYFLQTTIEKSLGDLASKSRPALPWSTTITAFSSLRDKLGMTLP